MKHLLNNLSNEEKQSILEQHNGGMKVFSENFKRLIKHKSGSIVSEQTSPTPSQKPAVGGMETIKVDTTVQIFDFDRTKTENRGEYRDSWYLKTVKTLGKYLGLVFDYPLLEFSDDKEWEYDCRKKAIFNYNNGKKQEILVFGPTMQKRMDEFCTKSMGVASTQKTGGVSGIA